MASRVSPLRAFQATRSVLSIRSLSTNPTQKKWSPASIPSSSSSSGSSSSSATLVRDLGAGLDNAGANRAAAAAKNNNPSWRYIEMANNIVRETQRRSPLDRKALARQIQMNQEISHLREIEATSRRRWKGGEVYAPHDLSASEARKWRKRQTPDTDVFDQLAINPLDEWKNVAMMGEFQTSMGRIKPRKETGLRPVNQRKIAKAIRRGIGMGFLPSVHAHPEILRRSGKMGAVGLY